MCVYSCVLYSMAVEIDRAGGRVNESTIFSLAGHGANESCACAGPPVFRVVSFYYANMPRR